MLVVLDHLGANDILLGAPLIHCHLHVLFLRMRPDVTRGRVEPTEKWRFALALLVEPCERVVENL
jgi:hypothetical protein